jgi:tetratricopeptide (TPR) repeat protein
VEPAQPPKANSPPAVDDHGVVKASVPPRGMTPATAPAAFPANDKYVLRLTERGRMWEVELPESTGGYELRIPMGAGVETTTAADEQLLGKDAKSGKSYLSTLARVGDLYAARKYEMALIEVVDLETQYPGDARIQSMKGSLYQKLGKAILAREAWRKALAIDPSDTGVVEALRGLKED